MKRTSFLIVLTLAYMFQVTSCGFCSYSVQCRTYATRSCGTWNWSRCSYTKYITCYKQRCCSGWTGSSCNIPICSNGCLNGGTCLRPHTCSCTIYYTGSYCQTKKSCVGKKIELFFLLDSSGSIGRKNFDEVKDLVRNVSQVLDIAQNKTRVGLMTFSRFPIIRLKIVDTENKTQVLDDINKIRYVPGLTETHAALSLLQLEGYFGSRSNIPHVAILITEGKSLHPKETSTAAASLHSHGIQMFVVGIGQTVAATELQTIATDPDSTHLFTVDGYKQLPSIIEKLTTLTCDVSAHSYKPVTTPKPVLFNHTYGDPVRECIGKAADVVFVIDSTTTIGESHFKSVKRFALDIVNDFDIADNATRVGVITFSTYPLLRLPLGKLNTKLEVLNFVNNLMYFTGNRETDMALELLRIEGMLNHRPATPNIAILITDGPSDNSFLTIRAAEELKQSSVEIFVVGIGNKVDVQELGSISSNPKDHVFTVANFDELDLSSFEGAVANTVCKDIPFLTTQSTTSSTSTTTTPEPMSTTRSPWLISGNETSDCVPEVKDVLFLVDSSTRVGEQNFLKMKKFIKQTVGSFNIDSNQTRVGLILFRTNATLVFPLDKYNTSQDIQNAVENIKYAPEDKTNTAKALEFARTQGFTYDRPTAPNIAFLITDGYSSDKNATQLQASLAKKNNMIQIVAIAVGQYVDFDELVEIASQNPYTNKSLFYSVDDFDDLHVMSLENVLTSVICGFQILATTPITTMSTTTSTTLTPCYDKVKNCDEYKQDMCTSYRPWALAHCSLYCGFCHGIVTPGKPCLDTIDNCHEYGPNICNSATFRKWTKDHCLHFCGLCGSTHTPIRSTPSNPKFEVPPTPTPKNSSCYNKVENCDLYTQDMCSSYRPWAMEHCNMYCGFCAGVPTPAKPCVDTVTNCAEYGSDLCTSPAFLRWTKQHCPRYCGLCGRNITPRSPSNSLTPTKTISTTPAYIDGNTTPRSSSNLPISAKKISTTPANTDGNTTPRYSPILLISTKKISTTSDDTEATTESQRNSTLSTPKHNVTTSTCFDKLAMCNEIDRNMCTDYKSWAMDNCRRFCGLCQGLNNTSGPSSSPSPCADAADNCQQFVPDICTSAPYRNWATENCAKFCNFCGN